MIQINKRSIGVCILLSIITFGIYGIYWLYLLVKNTRSIQKNTTSCTGEMLCLIFVPFYSLYWWYTRGEKVKQEFSQHNYASTGNGIVYLILAIFGLSIVSMAIMQSDFNSLKSEPHSEQRSTKNTKNNTITFGLILIAYFVIQAMISADSLSSLLEGLLVPVCTYVILAVSLNLTVGILGELSLGHAGFMCVGAFSGAVFTKCMVGTIDGIPLFILAALIGAACAAVFGFLIGIPVLRLRGDYLAIVTLAFGEIIKNIINVIYLGRDASGFHISFDPSKPLNLAEGGEMIIEGAQGLTKAPRLSTFTIGVVLVVITLIIVLNLVHSRTGRAVMAIRDDRIAAESVGINITKFKLLAFTISAALAGVAGVLYAHNFAKLSATPQTFGYNASIMILVYVVLGGIGNVRGSIVSTIILVLIPELLRGLQDYRMLVYAIVLIVTMLINWSPKAIEMKEKLFVKVKSVLPDKKEKEGNR